MQSAQAEEKETARIEAFSDGVFAIAVTLLVLELKIPHLENASQANLSAALLQQWPSYVAFFTSFFTILIMWINHHGIFKMIRKTDVRVMLSNGFLLFLVTAVPFPTALVSQYFTDPGGPLACALYSGLYVAISIAYNLLWWSVIYKRRLLKSGVSEKLIQTITKNYRYGFPLYLAATLCAFVSTYLSIGICTGLCVFWAITMKDS